jgi:hydrogenase nickel incorporation protein HypA/HybF
MVDMALDVAEKNGGGRVVGMRLLLGDMTSIEAETLTFAFDVVSRGTRAEGCALQIVRIPTRLRCRACGAERSGELLDPCACGLPGGEVLGGRELRVDTIDVEDAAEKPPGES